MFISITFSGYCVFVTMFLLNVHICISLLLNWTKIKPKYNFEVIRGFNKTQLEL